MTLIAGLLCSDGIVLSSDREENAGYLSKRSVKKIHDWAYGEWSMCIATCGRSSVADLATRKIMADARSSGESFLPDHATVITDALIQIMKKHVYNEIFPEHEKHGRKINLIIGIHDRASGCQYLYKTDDEILCPCDEFACSGIGEDIATYFLERLFDSALLCEEAELLATFVLREAKESVQTVGQETEIVTLCRDGLIGRNKYSLAADMFDVPRHLTHCMNKFWKRPKSGNIL